MVNKNRKKVPTTFGFYIRGLVIDRKQVLYTALADQESPDVIIVSPAGFKETKKGYGGRFMVTFSKRNFKRK